MLKTLSNPSFKGARLVSICPNNKPAVELTTTVNYNGIKDTFSKGECKLTLPNDKDLKNALEGYNWEYGTRLATTFSRFEDNYPDNKVIAKVEEWLNTGLKPVITGIGNYFQKSFMLENSNDIIIITVKNNSEVEILENIHKPFGIVGSVYCTSLDQVKGSTQEKPLKQLINRITNK